MISVNVVGGRDGGITKSNAQKRKQRSIGEAPLKLSAGVIN